MSDGTDPLETAYFTKLSHDPGMLNIAVIGELPGMMLTTLPRHMVEQRGEPLLSQEFETARSAQFDGDLDDFAFYILMDGLRLFYDEVFDDDDAPRFLAVVAYLIAQGAADWREANAAMLVTEIDDTIGTVHLGTFATLDDFKQQLRQFLHSCLESGSAEDGEEIMAPRRPTLH